MHNPWSPSHNPSNAPLPVAQNGYITIASSGSPRWGELNLEKSACGGDEQKRVKRGGNG